MSPFLRMHIKVPGEVLEAFESVRRARQGDTSLLATRWDRKTALSDEEREEVSRLIRGQSARAASRPVKINDRLKFKVAVMVYAHELAWRSGRDAAVAAAEELFSLSARRVYEVLREYKRDPEMDRTAREFAEFIQAIKDGALDVRSGGPALEVTMVAPGRLSIDK